MMNSSTNAAFENIYGYTAYHNCQGFQFKVGKTLEYERKTKTTQNGFYFCRKNPIFALTYYHFLSGDWSPTGFAEVSTKTKDALVGQTEEVCLAPKIKVNKLVTLDELIEAQIKASYQSQNGDFIATKDNEKLSSNDEFAIIASDKKSTSASINGYNSTIVVSGWRPLLEANGLRNALLAIGSDAQLISNGGRSLLYANGDRAQVSSIGYDNQITVTGHCSRVTSGGDCEKIYTDGDDAKIFSGGCDAAITVIGDRARITATGDECDVTYNGADGVLFIAGNYGKFSCSEGTLVQAVVYDSGLNSSGDLIGRIGENGLKPNTQYTVQYGKFIEVAAEEAEIE